MLMAYCGESALILKVSVVDSIGDGVVVKLDQHHGTAFKRNARFVEGHMTATTHTDNLKVNPSRCFDFPGVAVQNFFRIQAR
ncbi:MAG: hypothetical protein MZV70_10395 [Desulfobacterales bacterium]|nr:hypothetical protein [Desulfobacterales bacterium]